MTKDRYLMPAQPFASSFAAPGSIVWVSLPAPEGGWGRLRDSEDGKLEFISFAKIPPTDEEKDAITKMCVDLTEGEEA